jgi:hypothetical protein
MSAFTGKAERLTDRSNNQNLFLENEVKQIKGTHKNFLTKE